MGFTTYKGGHNEKNTKDRNGCPQHQLHTMCNGTCVRAADSIYATIQVSPDYKNILLFIEKVKQKLDPNDTYDIECGYEAGCLGYSLYNQLTSAGVKCVILAPTTMLTQQGNRIKTDTRDALMIAQCLSYRQQNLEYNILL